MFILVVRLASYSHFPLLFLTFQPPNLLPILALTSESVYSRCEGAGPDDANSRDHRPLIGGWARSADLEIRSGVWVDFLWYTKHTRQ